MNKLQEACCGVVGTIIVIASGWCYNSYQSHPVPPLRKCCPVYPVHPVHPPRKCCPGPCSASIFTVAPPIRNVGDLPPIIADVESHLPAGHVYDDPDQVTTVHECTHVINSLLRNRYNCPAFYVLRNRAVLMQEPATTLSWSTVADQVPVSLRGEVYGLYLKQMQNYWESNPTYVFDEWSAYTNGANARMALGIKDRGETVRYAVEFIVYSMCVPRAAKSTDPQMRAFIMWQTERVLKIVVSSGSARDWEYLKKLQADTDAESLRRYIRSYCGAVWARKELGL